MRPVFADPKTDFVFKRIFGTEVHKPLLIELLNALLELEGEHRIVDLKYLSSEQHVPIEELKLSVVDVKCFDQTGRHYVVEMQLLNVEGFEKRVVYNASKAYVTQLHTGEDYPQLDDVVGVTILDFLLWPEPPQNGGAQVPMLSRWRMQEQHGGARGLGQVQYVFLELPKYTAGENPQTVIDRWAYFFREAENLEVIPPPLALPPFRDALEVARMAHFNAAELDSYDRAKIAEQDARGALSLALRQGREAGRKEGRAKGLEEGRTEGLEEGRTKGLEEGRTEGREQGRAEGREQGRTEGLRLVILALCRAFGVEVDAERTATLEAMDAAALTALQERVLRDRSWS